MKRSPTIQVRVDVTNPGQFFACCGLLELADRLWPGAEGWFSESSFLIAAEGQLGELLTSISGAEYIQMDAENSTSSPMIIGSPFSNFRLDWWQDVEAGGSHLKTWAGTMAGTRIGTSMKRTLKKSDYNTQNIFNVGEVVYDAEEDNDGEKVEPFYFDSRRAGGAHSQDIGFAPNDLKKYNFKTICYPAVEFLCLVGLQRSRPRPTKKTRRIFEYVTWGNPLPPELMPLAISGHYSFPPTVAFRFENWFRTGQRKHKAFRSAQPLPPGVTP